MFAAPPASEPPAPKGIHAATHVDGKCLLYHEESRSFQLGADGIDMGAVRSMDDQRQLTWTRFDVRHVLRQSLKRGTVMGDLPVPKEYPRLEKLGSVLEAVANASAPKSGQMICPHCQSKGTVTTKEVKRKKGVSGGKATAAVLTGGWSILATGLSRKESMTEAHCRKCGSTWHF
ncbi:MAG: hypothetical protein RBS78_08545 [Coriobacteriia bacterium]|nr:hypothetical protein [Coriobacteriia bacterium]